MMDSVEANRTTFKVVDEVLAAPLPELLGLWTTGIAPTGSVASFGSDPSTIDRSTVWQVSLPADVTRARAQMNQAEAQIAAANRAMDQAEGRLIRAAEGQPDVSTAFAVDGQEPEVRKAEADLAAFLRAEDVVSFDPSDPVTEGISSATLQFQSLAQRTPQLLGRHAAVVTQVGDDIVAQTLVNWQGDASSAWRPNLDPKQAALHLRTVLLTLKSRTALFRMLALTVQGALTLAWRLAIPGGAVLAIPAAWRFVNQVLAELGRYSERGP